MRAPLRLRVRSVLRTFRRCRTVHLPEGGFDCSKVPVAVLVPWRDRKSVVVFAWRTGVQNPSSIWCHKIAGDDHYVAVYSR
jgi:hypothetical protein